MPFYIGGGQLINVEEAANSVDNALTNLMGQVAAFRARVAANTSVASLDAMNIYQAAASTRRHVSALVSAVNAVGLAQAYGRRYPNRPGFSPANEWPTAKAELDQFVTWMKNTLPKDVNGRFAFYVDDANGELASYDIPLTEAAKTALITRLDALLAMFPSA